MISGSTGRVTTPTDGETEGAGGVSDLTEGLMEEESGWGVRVSADAAVGFLIGECAAIHEIGGRGVV